MLARRPFITGITVLPSLLSRVSFASLVKHAKRVPKEILPCEIDYEFAPFTSDCATGIVDDQIEMPRRWALGLI